MKTAKIRTTFLCVAFLLFAQTLSVWAESSERKVDFAFFDDDVLGERLIVSPRVRSDDPSGSLEIRLTDQAYYDIKEYDFAIREIATVSGQGLGNEGIIFIVENDQNREEFIQLLEAFAEQAKNFRQHRSEMSGKVQPWMGPGDRMLSGSRTLGILQTDFISKPSEATINWDLGQNRLWLSIDGLINIDSRFSETLLDLVTRIPEFSDTRKKMSREVKERNEEINELLRLPQT